VNSASPAYSHTSPNLSDSLTLGILTPGPLVLASRQDRRRGDNAFLHGGAHTRSGAARHRASSAAKNELGCGRIIVERVPEVTLTNVLNDTDLEMKSVDAGGTRYVMDFVPQLFLSSTTSFCVTLTGASDRRSVSIVRNTQPHRSRSSLFVTP
jgi:hypothetical protein